MQDALSGCRNSSASHLVHDVVQPELEHHRVGLAVPGHGLIVGRPHRLALDGARKVHLCDTMQPKEDGGTHERGHGSKAIFHGLGRGKRRSSVISCIVFAIKVNGGAALVGGKDQLVKTRLKPKMAMNECR